MFCSLKSPAQRRYWARMWITAGVCVLFAIADAFAFRYGHLHGVAAYLAAILPALPILGALAATGVYLDQETDEFQRNILVQSVLGGTGGTLAATTVWGYLEDLTHIPHLDPIWVYPIFWLFVVLSYPLVRMRYR
jgi:hypothetical protein